MRVVGAEILCDVLSCTCRAVAPPHLFAFHSSPRGSQTGFNASSHADRPLHSNPPCVSPEIQHKQNVLAAMTQTSRTARERAEKRSGVLASLQLQVSLGFGTETRSGSCLKLWRAAHVQGSKATSRHACRAAPSGRAGERRARVPVTPRAAPRGGGAGARRAADPGPAARHVAAGGHHMATYMSTRGVASSARRAVLRVPCPAATAGTGARGVTSRTTASRAARTG